MMATANATGSIVATGAVLEAAAKGMDGLLGPVVQIWNAIAEKTGGKKIGFSRVMNNYNTDDLISSTTGKIKSLNTANKADLKTTINSSQTAFSKVT